MTYGEFFLVLCFLIFIVFGIVASSIAKKKGYSALGFFFLGLLVPIVGVVVAIFISDKSLDASKYANALISYKQLAEEGVISQEEFEEKKKELISRTKGESGFSKAKRSLNSFCYFGCVASGLTVFLVATGTHSKTAFTMTLLVAAAISIAYLPIARFIILKKREMRLPALAVGAILVIAIIVSFLPVFSEIQGSYILPGLFFFAFVVAAIAMLVIDGILLVFIYGVGRE